MSELRIYLVYNVIYVRGRDAATRNIKENFAVCRCGAVTAPTSSHSNNTHTHTHIEIDRHSLNLLLDL